MIWAARVYILLCLLLVAFQLALAAGMPWGELAMGGRWPGVFPLPLRLAAAAQAALIGWFALVVAGHAGLLASRFAPPRAIWVALVFAIMAVAANLATPSAAERNLWAPVAVVMLVCVVVILRAGRRGD